MKKLRDHLIEEYPDRISEINEAYQSPSTDSIRGLLIALGAIKGRPRTMMNGDLVFPQRGEPPKQVPGYMIDEHIPFVQHRIYKDCEQRYYKDVSSACCKGTKRVYFCKLDDFVTNYIRCGQCETARTGSSSGTGEAIPATSQG